ncbi:MAG TPA: TolC family outer membrane protein [Solimonas sp.]
MKSMQVVGHVLLIALGVAAMPAQALSLREAAEAAVRQDPRAAAAQAAVDAADAQLLAARAGYLPSVAFAAEAGRMDLQTKAPFPQSGPRNPNSVSLGLSQPLYSGGRTRAQLDAAEAALTASRDDASERRQQLMLGAITAYLDVLRERAVQAQAEASRRTLDAAAGDTRKRFDAGEVTRTDVAQAEARAAEALALESGARARLRAAEARFERAVGQTPATLDDGWAVPPLPASRDEALQWAGAAPPVLAAAADARGAQARVKLAQGGHRPSLSLEAQANTRDNTEFGYERLDTWQALVKLSLPIYQGGAVDAQIAQARAQAAQVEALAVDTQRAARESALEAWELWQAAQLAVPAYEAQVNAAELAADAVRKELDVGTRTTLDLLDAERERLAARVNLASSQRDRALAAYRLLAVCGRLTPESIR